MTLIANIEEIWKPIKGYEGRYSVSNHGRVWSHIKEKELVLIPDGQCYLYVNLYKEPPNNHKAKKHYPSRLVAEYFLSTWNPELQVNHIDGDKSNNHISNLEMVTPQENIRHGYRLGLCKSGENHPYAKLTNSQVDYIRSELNSLSCVKVAMLFGVSGGCIEMIRKGLTYKMENRV